MKRCLQRTGEERVVVRFRYVEVQFESKRIDEKTGEPYRWRWLVDADGARAKVDSMLDRWRAQGYDDITATILGAPR